MYDLYKEIYMQNKKKPTKEQFMKQKRENKNTKRQKQKNQQKPKLRYPVQFSCF